MKAIPNSYLLPNKDVTIPPEDIRRSVTDFEFFMANYAQIVGKDRHLHPFKLNPFQELLFKELMPLISKETRLDKQLNCVILKPRQTGCTTGMIAFINYICSYLNDFQHTSICHVLPVADTTAKLFKKKVEPIISGVHENLYPTVERETLGSSIMTHYKHLKGIVRDNYYEIVSAGASSIRSDTISIAVFDELGFYKHPEVIVDATLGSMPDYGFSLAVYMSTFEDRNGGYFLDKIKTARDNPEDWKLIFAPWFIMYPEREQGLDYKELELTDYDSNVIIPAMQEFGIPVKRWGDCIDWYHRKSKTILNVQKEFPTTLDEIIQMGEDDCVFSEASLKAQEENIEPDHFYKLVTDNLTGNVEAQPTTDPSPLKIYRPPVYGRRYRIAIDPITAQSDSTDYFSMVVFDTQSHEQMAVFHERGLEDDAYSDYAVALAKIYNNAELCPEINVAAGFVAGVNNRHYYRWFYANEKARRNKEIGLRTTASSKDVMIDKLKALLDRKLIKIHDQETLDELRSFVKKVKLRSDGSKYIRMEAKGKKKDDLCASLWIYAGSLAQRDIEQKAKVGFSLAW